MINNSFVDELRSHYKMECESKETIRYIDESVVNLFESSFKEYFEKDPEVKRIIVGCDLHRRTVRVVLEFKSRPLVTKYVRFLQGQTGIEDFNFKFDSEKNILRINVLIAKSVFFDQVSEEVPF